MADRIIFRHDTKENWARVNPILMQGEEGIEDDTKLRKLGDGINAWNDLDYIATENVIDSLGNSKTAAISQKAVTNNVGFNDYEEFSDAKEYHIGDIVIKDGYLKEFTAEHPIGSWIGTDTKDTSIKKQQDNKLTEIDDIIINFIFSNETGKLTKHNGRFQINRLFAIDSEPIVSFTPELTVVKRYYDINGQFIGVDYTSNAKFISIGAIINDELIAITKNEIAKYVLSFNGAKYQCVNGLPLVYGDVVSNCYVQPNKFFINKADGDISVKFSNIRGDYCDVIVNAINGAILLNVQSENFIHNLQNVSFSHVPYRYGMLYAEVKTETQNLNSYKVGRLGIYGTDVDVLEPEQGYYYIPIIAWDEGKIIYRIENYSEYNELRTKILNVVTKDEMSNFDYQQNFILGQYVAGRTEGEPVTFPSDPKRGYLNKVIKANAGDTIVLETIVGDSGITNVQIRCIDDNGNYVGTPNTAINNTFELPIGTTGYYISFVSSVVLTNENVANTKIIINGTEYYLYYGKEGYINSADGLKAYIDEVINNLNIPENYYGNLVGCFERIVCLGNSITAGYTGSEFAGQNVGSNDARVTARNWPAYFAKSIGSDVVNLGYGSSKTTDWRNSTPETEAQNLYCAMDLANIEGTQAYFNMIGWNDTIAVGTSADIQTDYNDNAMSFYGNYDYIVRKLHDYKPKAHIFVFTLARGKKNSPYNDAIRYIAALYPDYCHCIDYSNDPFFDTVFFNAVADGTHYSPLGYNAFAQLVKSLVSKYIYDNPDKFKGIPYTADENIKGSIDVQGMVSSYAKVEIQEIGTYTTLVANILPNTAANKNVSWSIISGDSSCIKLIPNQSTMYCTIKGIKQGFALVQASSEEGYKAVCMVSVAQEIVNVTSIKLNNTTLDIPLSEGEKVITATIIPDEATNKNIKWALESGKDDIATIEATLNNCIITPRNKGTDTIIAISEDGNKEAKCIINVI